MAPQCLLSKGRLAGWLAVCDYVQLNSARAKVLKPEQPLSALAGIGKGVTVDWCGLPCEGRFWERKLRAAKPYYL